MQKLRGLAISVFISGLGIADELKKLSLDDMSGIGTRIQTDTQVRTEGKGSIRITTQ